MSDSKKRTGLGVCDVLAIVFIVRKLVGVINWSWVWVLSPIWISIIIVLVLCGVIAIIDD